MSDLEIQQPNIKPAFDELKRFQQQLRKTSQWGVVSMAKEIAGAAATATRVAGKTRTSVLKGPDGKKRKGIRFIKKATGPNQFTLIPVRAETAAEAKLHKRAQIKKRGLAKMAWFWIASDLGQRGKGVSGSTVKKSRSAFGVVNRSKAKNPEIKIHDKLSYAQDAFRVKGRATVDNIGSRAANRFARKVELGRA